jgi:hypothetical protein
LVATNPVVTYHFEPNRIWRVAGGAKDRSDRFDASRAKPEVRAAIRAWFAVRAADTPLYVAKHPQSVLRVPFLQAVLPEAKLVHIVRDGRDVACSLLPSVGGDTWHHMRPPSWRTLFAEHTGVERCALAWKETIEIALDDLASVPHLQIRYEDLVADPLANARVVLDYLGLALSPDVDAFCQKVQASTEGSHQAAKQDRWYQPDHRSRVERWRENLTPELQEHLTELLREPLARLRYL